MSQSFENVIDRIGNREYDALKFEFASEDFNWANQIFEQVRTRRNPHKTALIWFDQYGKEKRFTFNEFVSHGNRFLNAFREKGLRKGDPIFVMLPVYPEVWLSYFAANKGGFVLIPTATVLTAEDIIYRFGQCFPSAVLVDSSGAERIDEAERVMGKKIPIKIIVGDKKESYVSVSEIDRYGDTAEAEKTRPDERFLIFFTSGTTGLPKMVEHTHSSYPVGSITTAAWIGLGQNDVHYNISQPGWAKFAWSSFFAPLMMGATVIGYHYEGRFVPKDHLELLQKYRVTTFCAPPTVWRLLILEDLPAYKFSLKQVVSAGEPLNPEVIVSWKSKTGLTIRDGYGQTESTLMIGNMPNSEVRLGSMGRPVGSYEIAIVDENGLELPFNEEGNIAVRLSPRPIGLLSGYIGDEERAKISFRGPFYYTGDRAYKDPEGRIWFVGRGDDVIKSSDYRIGPFEVESVLVEHPAVRESAVVGSPDPMRGNIVKAFIVLKPGYKESAGLAKELFTFSREKLAHYKAPRLLEFSDELPKTISGKIRRVELRGSEIESKHKNEKRLREFSIGNF